MAVLCLHGLFAVAFLGTGIAQIAPEHAENVTVYHLNPASAGAMPVNMDTGDALGDLFFYLGQFLLPLECKNASKDMREHFDCDNPERVDENLVVTKVDMQIDSRLTIYSACNLCNGTDPFSGKPCEVGSYDCDCMKFASKGRCDASRVGRSSIKDNFAPHATSPKCAAALQKSCGKVKMSKKLCPACELLHKNELIDASCGQNDFWNFCPGGNWTRCTATSPEWVCWAENIPRKTHGYWYSTLEQGLCNTTSPAGSCSWKVRSAKTVKEACLKSKIITRVELASPSCFKACGQRNTSSYCWISCFFDALLGPQARHSVSLPLGGLPATAIEKAWTDAFLPEERGGCPSVNILPSWKVILDETVFV